MEDDHHFPKNNDLDLDNLNHPPLVDSEIRRVSRSLLGCLNEASCL